MSVEISLSGLAKSQLFTLKGEAITDFSPEGGLDISGARLQQSQSVIRLQNVVIDNKYKILSLLGEGGMGAVYKAHHLMLNKDVALKTFLSPNLTGDSWQRFQREAKAIASLSHNNIVQVFDFGVGENNVPYYTMEYLRGESLAERLNRVGPLSIDQTVQLFLQVCQAMSAAHNKGIIHRDLKPANIFLAVDEGATSKTELVKIVDFGIASLANESADDQKLTRAGTVFGSPLYMSPEQSMGAEATICSDIYSCGCALFETLTGSPPFRGKSALETMIQHQQEPVPRLSEKAPDREFPQRLNALLTQMMAKQQDARFQSMNQVTSELEAIAQRLASGAGGDQRNTQSLTGGGSPLSGDSLNNQSQTGEKKVVLPGKVITLLALGVFTVGGAIFAYLQSTWPSNQPGKIPTQVSKSSPAPAAVETVAAGGVNASTAPAASSSATEAPLATNTADSRPAAVDLSENRIMPLDELVSGGHNKPVSKPGQVSKSITPYLISPKDDKPGAARRFRFPKDRSIGRLSYYLTSGFISTGVPSTKIEARGDVTVPANVNLHLLAERTLAAEPELLTGFGPNDLHTLLFDDHFDWTNDHIHWITGLTGLSGLCLEDMNVSDICLDYVQKLPNLTLLSVNRSYITSTGLIRLKRLTNLISLKASNNRNMRCVLEKMEKNNVLDVLILSDCGLSDAEMPLMAKFPAVTSIDLNHNPITDTGLMDLAKTPKLSVLNVSASKVTASGCMNFLSRCPGIISLTVDDFPAAQRKLLEKTFPTKIKFASNSEAKKFELLK